MKKITRQLTLSFLLVLSASMYAQRIKIVAPGAFSGLNTSNTGQTGVFKTPSIASTPNNIHNIGLFNNLFITSEQSVPRFIENFEQPKGQGWKFEVAGNYHPILVSQIIFNVEDRHVAQGDKAPWIIQGSNNDSSWEDLCLPFKLTAGQTKTDVVLPLKTIKPYRFYRFVLNENWKPTQPYTRLNSIKWTVAATPVAKKWIGGTDGNWFNSYNWSENYVPTAQQNVIIPAGLNITAALTPINVNSITIEPGASLKATDINANYIYMESNSTSYSSLITSGKVAAGEVVYKRYTNKVGVANVPGGNDLISSPLQNVIFNQLFVNDNIENIVQNPDPTKKTQYAFAPYNLSTGKFENFDLNPPTAYALPDGKGYRAATKNGGSLTFIGKIPSGDVAVAIFDVGSAWNLIGNPYSSYVNFSTFFTTQNLSQLRDGYGSIYAYTGANGYVLYNKTNFPAPGGLLIAPGQGFFVKAKAGGGVINFTTAMRSIGNSNDFIASRPANTSSALSKLKLSSVSKKALTSIYFIEGTTRGLDHGYDAGVFTGISTDFSIFTNLLEDHTGLDLAIQALPYYDFNDVIVPLGIKAKAGAELSLSIDDLSTVPSNINVYLEDTEKETLTLLNDGAYTFKPTTDLNGADRFNIHYSSKSLSVKDMASNENLRIYTTASPKTLFIKGALSKSTTANLYDIQGRLVLSKILNSNNTENTMDISTIGTGIYVVQVKNDNQIKTQKVIIK